MNAETGDQFYYLDRDADGIFESVYHIDGNWATASYNLTEFAEKFGNAKMEESLSDDNLSETTEISTEPE